VIPNPKIFLKLYNASHLTPEMRDFMGIEKNVMKNNSNINIFTEDVKVMKINRNLNYIAACMRFKEIFIDFEADDPEFKEVVPGFTEFMCHEKQRTDGNAPMLQYPDFLLLTKAQNNHTAANRLLPPGESIDNEMVDTIDISTILMNNKWSEDKFKELGEDFMCDDAPVRLEQSAPRLLESGSSHTNPLISTIVTHSNSNSNSNRNNNHHQQQTNKKSSKKRHGSHSKTHSNQDTPSKKRRVLTDEESDVTSHV